MAEFGVWKASKLASMEEMKYEREGIHHPEEEDPKLISFLLIYPFYLLIIP